MFQFVVEVQKLKVAHAASRPPPVAAAAAAKPGGKTYCCGVGTAAACNGPDWMPISIEFGPLAAAANVSITIDGAAGACTAEACTVLGSKVLLTWALDFDEFSVFPSAVPPHTRRVACSSWRSGFDRMPTGACNPTSFPTHVVQVLFPNIASKADCLGKLITGTGALPTDLELTYDAGGDTVGFEVDSEGVTETLQVC